MDWGCGIFVILFPKLKSFDVFLGLSKVIGHLDVLEEEGRVGREQTTACGITFRCGKMRAAFPISVDVGDHSWNRSF